MSDGGTARRMDERTRKLWFPYTQMATAPAPLQVRAVEGSEIALADGRVLVDGVGSWWSAIHGYRHPHLLAAAEAQLRSLPHVMLGGLVHEQGLRLAERLTDLVPGGLGRVFFSESGSVAMEIALKIAVQYWKNARDESRTRFISFLGGYHGDTFATMAICDPEEGMHASFPQLVQDQHVIPLPDPDPDASGGALETLLAGGDDIAAVVVEPLIQGAGGMKMHPPEVLQRLRAACDAHGTLLIFDEIFTGFGRTGALFAAEKAGVAPDILALGKGLTGGVTPLAATLATERVFSAFDGEDPDTALMHGPTFTGHAVGCAVANASLDLFEREDLLAKVQSVEAQCREGLAPIADHPAVAEARCLGAVAAVELKRSFDIQRARSWFLDRGVFIRPLDRLVYLTPAYSIAPAQLETLLNAIRGFFETDIPAA